MWDNTSADRTVHPRILAKLEISAVSENCSQSASLPNRRSLSRDQGAIGKVSDFGAYLDYAIRLWQRLL